MVNNLPANWDLEADIVAIGSGIGGLSAAITAHDLGGSALVLERAEQLGGVTALSMGEVWIAGSRQGRELGRILGPADWASPEAVALVKAALAQK